MDSEASISNVLKERFKDINLDGNALLELKENIIIELKKSQVEN